MVAVAVVVAIVEDAAIDALTVAMSAALEQLDSWVVELSFPAVDTCWSAAVPLGSEKWSSWVQATAWVLAANAGSKARRAPPGPQARAPT